MPRPPSKSRSEEAVPSQLRVIAGTLRNRKIPYLGDTRTRPMKERVRESVYHLLGNVEGTWAIDLFAGTGALAIEALSRGAAKATLLERHIPTSRQIQDTLKLLDLAEQCEVLAADAFIWARRFVPGDAPPPFLVFCSPPYDFYVDRRDDVLAMLERLLSLAPVGSQFVVECDERFDVALLPTAHAWDVRTYPPAVVAIAEIKG